MCTLKKLIKKQAADCKAAGESSQKHQLFQHLALAFSFLNSEKISSCLSHLSPVSSQGSPSSLTQPLT